MEPAFAVLRKSGASDINKDNESFRITKIYPVPVSDGDLTVEIQSEKDQVIKINICSLYGNIIKRIGQEKLTRGNNVITSQMNLPSGYYVYMISGDNGEKCSKHIIIK